MKIVLDIAIKAIPLNIGDMSVVIVIADSVAVYVNSRKAAHLTIQIRNLWHRLNFIVKPVE